VTQQNYTSDEVSSIVHLFWTALPPPGAPPVTGRRAASRASGAGSGKLGRTTQFGLVAPEPLQSGSTAQATAETGSTKEKRGFEHKALVGASVLSLEQRPGQK